MFHELLRFSSFSQEVIYKVKLNINTLAKLRKSDGSFVDDMWL